MKTAKPGNIANVLTALIIVVFVGAAAHAAELTLARIFSDGAVLQREMAVPVWGSAAPGTKVTVSFGGQKKTSTVELAVTSYFSAELMCRSGAGQTRVKM